MKHYVIDEIRPQEYETLKKYLDTHLEPSGIDGLYWKTIDGELLTDIQAEHTDCAPFYFVFNLAPDQLSCELLARTKNRMRCDCIGYATATQRNWIIQYTEDIFKELELIT